MISWEQYQADLVACQKCDRLRKYCEKVAKEKRAAYRDVDYWGKPVPDFGDKNGRLLIVGLAPAAHGANRTGRMFTGDRSGDFLFGSLFRTGWANQALSRDREDGLVLKNAVITAAVHCAPPGNKPSPDENQKCFDWLVSLLTQMPEIKAVLALGGIAWNACLKLYGHKKWTFSTRPKFGHLAIAKPKQGPLLVGSYHPSQQNTFTGRLTPEMLDQVFLKLNEVCAS